MIKPAMTLAILALASCAGPTSETAAGGQTNACQPESILYPGADTWLVQLPDGSVRVPTPDETACLMALENAG